MTRLFFKLLFLTFYFIQSHAMMIRNDALISKMVSDFQKDNSMVLQPQLEPLEQYSQHQDRQPKNVLGLMQNVLCKNFPTVPCALIEQDETLKNLIERSIQQLKYKKLSMEKTTQTPTGFHLTLFPTFNSEDMSNFLQVSDTGYHQNKLERKRNKKRTVSINGDISREREPKIRSKANKEKRTMFSGRKKIRKFYPHKTKYRDKSKGRKDFGDFSEEKLSMSVEVPDMNMGGTQDISRMKYKAGTDDGDDPPVWRIDYLKHGEPGLNVFGSETDRLKEKLVKSSPNVVLSENMLEPSGRREVLHPDVYIKKSSFRKNALVELNSGALD